jgi:putative transposase
MKEAREKVESWRKFYNEERPHSSLEDLTPFEFFKEQNAISNGTGLNLQLAHIMG